MPVPGSPVYLKDVATVTDGIKETTSISRYNGKNGIGLMLKKQGDANAVDVSKLQFAINSKLLKNKIQEWL
jgi:HAE1 family hydrophobic/amphiphilic exporter-1